MSVLDTLAREHKVFGRLIARIEKSLRYDEATARKELLESILLLLAGLERHDELEDIVFGVPSCAGRRGVHSVLVEVDVQHRKIRALRGELLAALGEAQDEAYGRLKELMLLLAQKLRLHFQTEETRLWPFYLGHSSRSLDRCLGARAKKSVKLLERDIGNTSVAIAEYLGGPR